MKTKNTKTETKSVLKKVVRKPVTRTKKRVAQTKSTKVPSITINSMVIECSTRAITCNGLSITW